MHSFIIICIFDTKKKNMATNEERYKQAFSSAFSPNWTSQHKTFGKHGAKLSTDNPYFTQLNQAMSGGDEDALYELAIKWEAENAGYERERADKLADLAEQRAYDDPSAVVARNRKAGINLDLQGSSVVGGSGSGLSAPSMPSFETPTDNTSHFANRLDSHTMVTNAISSASSLLSAFSGLGSTIVNGISTMRMLPIAEKAGQLANQTAEQLQPHQVNAQRIANESAEMSLMSQSLSTLTSLSSSGFFTPDTTDEEYSNVLGTLGFGADRIPSLINGIKQYQSNPAYREMYDRAKIAQIKAEEEGKVYTRNVIAGLTQLAKDTEVLEGNLRFVTDDLQYKIANILNTDEYATVLADNSIMDANNGYKQRELLGKQLDRDLEAFDAQLNYLVDATKKSQSIIAEIRNGAKNRPLTMQESSLIEVEEEKIKVYSTLGSDFLTSARSLVINSIQNRFYKREALNSNGTYKPDWSNGTMINFMNRNLNFMSMVNGDVSTSEGVNLLKEGLQLGVGLLTKGKASGGITILNNMNN